MKKEEKTPCFYGLLITPTLQLFRGHVAFQLDRSRLQDVLGFFVLHEGDDG
jgi:hypothetical protein